MSISLYIPCLCHVRQWVVRYMNQYMNQCHIVNMNQCHIMNESDICEAYMPLKQWWAMWIIYRTTGYVKGYVNTTSGPPVFQWHVVVRYMNQYMNQCDIWINIWINVTLVGYCREHRWASHYRCHVCVMHITEWCYIHEWISQRVNRTGCRNAGGTCREPRGASHCICHVCVMYINEWCYINE